MTEEDEAFNEFERQAKQRKEAVRAAINKEKPMNNTPAFPNVFDHERGMTLRDYFAAKAMQIVFPNQLPYPHAAAQSAYAIADAMMNAREA
tara:strand:- start:31 stop:303 length:273 start_codon:yes stop_codon:yes gene_type:complete